MTITRNALDLTGQFPSLKLTSGGWVHMMGKRAVRILLECFLVVSFLHQICTFLTTQEIRKKFLELQCLILEVMVSDCY